jgi:putative cardiolipin synthase
MKWIALFLLCFCSSLQAEKNAVIVSENSEQTLKWMHELISHAEHSIELGAYSTGGKVFMDLIEAIEIRMDEVPPLEVYVIAAPIFLFDREMEKIECLKKEYPNFHFQVSEPHFKVFPDYNTNENHMKCLIVDEKYFIIGGTNLHEAFCTKGTEKIDKRSFENPVGHMMPSGTRDMDLIGSGPVAHDIRKMYHKMFALWEHFGKTLTFIEDPDYFSENSYVEINAETHIDKFESSPKRVEVEKIDFILGGPHQEKNAITQEYKSLIDLAKKEIVLGNFYFNPSPDLFESIHASVKKGVSYKLITNGLWDGSPFYATLLCWGNRVNYVPFLYSRDFHFWQKPHEQPSHNVRIYEYQVEDILYHKKAMVVDKRYSVIGSYNLYSKSYYSDYEIILVVDSPKIAAQVFEVLKIDILHSMEITPDDAIAWYFDPIIAYKGALQKLFQGMI